MKFREWLIEESTLSDLYHSTVAAFPRTTKRQHATQPIEISEINYTPFLGMRTLIVRGLAHNENRQYHPLIMFKNVIYRENQEEGLIKLIQEDGEYYLEQISMNDNDVNLRCDCADFYWRWVNTDHEDESLYGRNRKPYESQGIGPPANPMEFPGMCKHLLKLIEVLRNYSIIN
jgi:hypothetical protein